MGGKPARASEAQGDDPGSGQLAMRLTKGNTRARINRLQRYYPCYFTYFTSFLVVSVVETRRNPDWLLGPTPLCLNPQRHCPRSGLSRKQERSLLFSSLSAASSSSLFLSSFLLTEQKTPRFKLAFRPISIHLACVTTSLSACIARPQLLRTRFVLFHRIRTRHTQTIHRRLRLYTDVLRCALLLLNTKKERKEESILPPSCRSLMSTRTVALP